DDPDLQITESKNLFLSETVRYFPWVDVSGNTICFCVRSQFIIHIKRLPIAGMNNEIRGLAFLDQTLRELFRPHRDMGIRQNHDFLHRYASIHQLSSTVSKFPEGVLF